MTENKGQLLFTLSLWVLLLGIYCTMTPHDDIMYQILLVTSIVGVAGGVLYS